MGRFARLFWAGVFKMARYRYCNAVVVISCLVMVLYMWKTCQESRVKSSEFVIQKNNNLGVNGGGMDTRETEDDSDEGEEENVNIKDRRTENDREADSEASLTTTSATQSKSIDVLVNGEHTIQGRFEKDEVYIPFSFIKDYFEVDGKIISDTFGVDKLDMRHTFYEYFTPSTTQYSPKGSFLWFVNYNVEGRSRVRCITGVDEVPISTQWGPKGYYYPIQIAQYGLSHYSMLVEQNGVGERRKVIDDGGEGLGSQEWTAGPDSEFKYSLNYEKNSKVLHFKTRDHSASGVSLSLTSSRKAYILSFDIVFKSPGRIVVLLEIDDTKAYTIVYKTTSETISFGKNSVTYGIGGVSQWRHISRNLFIDLRKGMVEGNKKGKRRKREDQKKLKRIRLSEIQSMSLHGEGFIDNITLAETGHEAAFLASAKWLLRNQDKHGGWAVPVKRTIRGFTELKAGWYSAMAQGQAMSVLARAYHHTKKTRYLKAAEKATSLFHVKSADHGILATFMGKYHWYEEYPVSPSLFVLNGFLYSLMGLYDLKTTLPPERREDAESLFKQGMISLRAMLPMYDTGSGTIYDLRHLNVNVEPNRARWDYHATHVNQLLWITMIDKDPLYKTTLERWRGYFKGVRAKHN